MYCTPLAEDKINSSRYNISDNQSTGCESYPYLCSMPVYWMFGYFVQYCGP